MRLENRPSGHCQGKADSGLVCGTPERFALSKRGPCATSPGAVRSDSSNRGHRQTSNVWNSCADCNRDLRAEAFLLTKGTLKGVLGHGSGDLFRRVRKGFAYTIAQTVVKSPHGQMLANAANWS
jgi:hypothetical protein